MMAPYKRHNTFCRAAPQLGLWEANTLTCLHVEGRPCSVDAMTSFMNLIYFGATDTRFAMHVSYDHHPE